MKILTKLLVILLFAICFTLINSCKNTSNQDYNWYKGNLHMHSLWSDGDSYPEYAIEWYKTHDYNFVGLTDHNTVAEGDKWKTISETDIQQQAFDSYINKYGKNQLKYKIENERTIVKLKTYEEYNDILEEKGKFLILHSEEISDNSEGKPIHLNAINIQNYIEPQGGINIIDALQQNINAVEKQKEELSIPIITIINHPNFGFAFSDNELIPLNNARFIEFYNCHPSVINKGDSDHISTEEIWDNTNISYIKHNKALIYGIASDDAHTFLQFEKEYANPGRGWIMVKSDKLNPPAILNSMENGDFYSSSGVYLKRLNVKNNKLTISVDSKPGIKYQILFIGAYKRDTKARILKKTNTGSSKFKLKENLLYVRAKIISNKQKQNSIYEMEYEEAWTQPVVYQEK